MKWLVFLLTFRAETEEIQAMGENSVARLLAHLLAQLIKVDEVGIRYLPAPRTDDMRVGERLVAVVSVASIRKPQFEHLVQFLEKGNGLVYRGQACCREFDLDLLINLFHTWVPFAGGENSEHGQPLRGYPEAMTLEPGKHLRDAFLYGSRSATTFRHLTLI